MGQKIEPIFTYEVRHKKKLFLNNICYIILTIKCVVIPENNKALHYLTLLKCEVCTENNRKEIKILYNTAEMNN